MSAARASSSRAPPSASRSSSATHAASARKPSRAFPIAGDAGKDMHHAIEVDSDSDSNESWHSAIDIRSPSPPPVDPTPRLTAQRRRDEQRARELARREREVIDVAGSSSASDSEDGDGFQFLGSRDPSSFRKRKRTSRRTSPADRGPSREGRPHDQVDSTGSSRASSSRDSGGVEGTIDLDYGLSIPQSMLSFAMPTGPALGVPVLRMDTSGSSSAAVEMTNKSDGAIAEVVSDMVDDLLNHTDSGLLGQEVLPIEAAEASVMELDAVSEEVKAATTDSVYHTARPDPCDSSPDMVYSSTTTSDTAVSVNPHMGIAHCNLSVQPPVEHTPAAARSRRPTTPPLPSEDEGFSDYNEDGWVSDPLSDHDCQTVATRSIRPLTPPLPCPPASGDRVNRQIPSSDFSFSMHQPRAPRDSASPRRYQPNTPPGTPPPLTSPVHRSRPLTPPGLPPSSESFEEHASGTHPGHSRGLPVHATRTRSPSPIESASGSSPAAYVASPVLRHPLPPRPAQSTYQNPVLLDRDASSARGDELRDELRARKRVRTKRRPASERPDTEHEQTEDVWLSRPPSAPRAVSVDLRIEPASREHSAPSLRHRISSRRSSPSPEPAHLTGAYVYAERPPLMARFSSNYFGRAAATAPSASPVQQVGPPKRSLAERMASKCVQRPLTPNNAKPWDASLPIDRTHLSPATTSAHPASVHSLPSRPSSTHTSSNMTHLPAEILTLRQLAVQLAEEGSSCLNHVEITTSDVPDTVHETIDEHLSRLGALVLALDDPRLYVGRPALQGNRFVVMESKSDAYPEGLVVAKKIDYAGLLALVGVRRALEVKTAGPRAYTERASASSMPAGTRSSTQDPPGTLSPQPWRPLRQRLGQGLQSPEIDGIHEESSLHSRASGIPLAARIGRQ